MVNISQAQLNQLCSTGSSMLGLSYEESFYLGQGANIVGSIFTIANSQGKANGDHAKRSMAKENIFQSVGNILIQAAKSLFGGVAGAKSDVNSSNSNINDGRNNNNEIAGDIQNDYMEISQNTDANLETITNILETVQKLQNDDLKETTQKLKEIQKNIQTNIDIINDKNKSNDEREKALENIKTFNGDMLGLVDNIAQIQESLTDYKSQAAETQQKINEDIEAFSNKLTESTAKATAAATEVAPETQKNALYVTYGFSEQTQGVTYNAEGSALSSNVFTAALAPELFNLGRQYTQAGLVHEQGAAKNFALLGQFGTEFSVNLQNISSYTNTLGGWDTYSQGLFGTLEEALNSLITSVGSYEGINEFSEGLTVYVDECEEKLNGDNQTEDTDMPQFDLKLPIEEGVA